MSAIAKRFISGDYPSEARDILDVIMDLEVVHKRTPLRLEAMLEGPLIDLARDVILIRSCVERRGPDAGKLVTDLALRYALD